MSRLNDIDNIYFFLKNKFKEIFNSKYGFELNEHQGYDGYFLIYLNEKDIIELDLKDDCCLLFINISDKYNIIQRKIYKKITSELDTLSINDDYSTLCNSYKIDSFHKANKVIDKLKNVDFDLLFLITKYNL